MPKQAPDGLELLKSAGGGFRDRLRMRFGGGDDNGKGESDNMSLEQLRGGARPDRVYKVPLAYLDFDNKQFYNREAAETLDLKEFQEQIKVQGQLYPVITRPGPGDKLQIVAGWRRSLALKALNKPVAVYVWSLDDQNAALIAGYENIQRESLSDWSTADYIRRMRDEFKISPREIAEKLGKGRQYTYEILSIFDHPEVVASLKARKIALTSARLISRTASSKKAKPELVASIVAQVESKKLPVTQIEKVMGQRAKSARPDERRRAPRKPIFQKTKGGAFSYKFSYTPGKTDEREIKEALDKTETLTEELKRALKTVKG